MNRGVVMTSVLEMTVDELIRNIDAVTADDILEVANQFINPQNFITVVLKPNLQ